jgi:CarD family transcriptional regulator
MEFHIGDKIVHPTHGPGQITALERKEFMDGSKRYFVIEIPGQGLTVYIPRKKMQEIGIRPAIRQTQVATVFGTLQSKPHPLPADYRVRQEKIEELLRTGRVIPIAKAVRDLTWQRERDHLTQKDSDCLRRGRDLLAAEIALASDSQIADVHTRMDAALLASMASAS